MLELWPEQIQIMDRFWDKVDKNGPTMPGMDSNCWVWTAYRNMSRGGYGVFCFNGEAVVAHRASWEINVGPIPKDDSHHKTRHILHKCDNPICVRPNHLFIGKNIDNIMDMLSKDRQHKGENTGGVVATKSQVIEIRSLWPKMKQCALSIKFGLPAGVVHCIVHRKTWKHID